MRKVLALGREVLGFWSRAVPVLSEQMTVVQPSVSTDGSLRTIAFFIAILRVPSARQRRVRSARRKSRRGRGRDPCSWPDDWPRWRTPPGWVLGALLRAFIRQWAATS